MKETEFKFIKKEESRAGKVYIEVIYAGGDADTKHPDEYLLNIPFDKDMIQSEVIDKELAMLKTLKNVLEQHSDDNDYDYNAILEEHGKDMAKKFDNVPNDPQNDFQDKCYLDDAKLIGYDLDGTRYEAYLNI